MAVEEPRLSTLLVCTHNATESTAGDAAATRALVETASDLLQKKVAAAKGNKKVLVVACGGKRDWRNELSEGEIVLRELTRAVGIETFAPAAARATLEVEGRSKCLEDAARNAASMLALGSRLARVSSMTVVCGSDARAEVRRVFSDHFPGVNIDVAAPKRAAADDDAPDASPKRRRGGA